MNIYLYLTHLIQLIYNHLILNANCTAIVGYQCIIYLQKMYQTMDILKDSKYYIYFDAMSSIFLSFNFHYHHNFYLMYEQYIDWIPLQTALQFFLTLLHC